MPCVLPADDALSYPTWDAKLVPAMVMEFPAGGPMLGSFCDLVCYLITVIKWKLAMKLARNGHMEPFHITRSSIHFRAPKDMPGKIIISDPFSSFFLVEFEGPSAVAAEVCPLIRETILVGVEQVSKNLHYSNPIEAEASAPMVNHPNTTFLCPCRILPLHPATMSYDQAYLSCPIESKKYREMTPLHKAWFGGEDTLYIPLG